MPRATLFAAALVVMLGAVSCGSDGGGESLDEETSEQRPSAQAVKLGLLKEGKEA